MKPKLIGGMEIENGAVNEVVAESEIISRSLTFGEEAAENMASAIAKNEEAVSSIADAISKKSTYDEGSGKLTLM